MRRTACQLWENSEVHRPSHLSFLIMFSSLILWILHHSRDVTSESLERFNLSTCDEFKKGSDASYVVRL